ncbi:MAG: putative holin-like toxin [Bacillota bacterium]
MSTFEALMLMLNFGLLLVMLLEVQNRKK